MFLPFDSAFCGSTFCLNKKNFQEFRGSLEPGENSPTWPIWPWASSNSASSSHSTWRRFPVSHPGGLKRDPYFMVY